MRPIGNEGDPDPADSAGKAGNSDGDTVWSTGILHDGRRMAEGCQPGQHSQAVGGPEPPYQPAVISGQGPTCATGRGPATSDKESGDQASAEY